MKLPVLGWSHPLINYLIQFIFIFSSVFLAFYLTDVYETDKLRTVEHKAITAVYQELQQNLKALEEAAPYHEEVRDILSALTDSLNRNLISVSGKTTIDILQQRIRRKANSLGAPGLQDISWKTFQGTDAHVLLDYEVASGLGRQYQMQKIGVEATSEKLKELFLSRDIFDPSITTIKLQECFWLFNELLGQETYLIMQTSETLKLLEEAYPKLLAPKTED